MLFNAPYHLDARDILAEIDVTFSGGGFKNAYCLGVGLALEILQSSCDRGFVKRWSGASAGVSFVLLRTFF